MNKKTLENLKNIILQKIQTDNFHEMDFITNIRQEECLNKSKQYLEDVLEAANNLQLQDLISIDIKSALYSLDECIGENINEEVLDHIFEQFCIGK